MNLIGSAVEREDAAAAFRVGEDDVHHPLDGRQVDLKPEFVLVSTRQQWSEMKEVYFSRLVLKQRLRCLALPCQSELAWLGIRMIRHLQQSTLRGEKINSP